MFKNFYLFKAVVSEIQDIVSGSVIVEAFTVHKNELILVFDKNESLYHLKICIDTRSPYLLLDSVSNYKGPRLNFFPELSGNKIETVKIIPFNKYCIINCRDYAVHACFYGKESNIVLQNSHNESIATFKMNRELGLPEIPVPDTISPTERLVKNIIDKMPHSSLLDLFSAVCPGCNFTMYDELCYRLQYSGDMKLENISNPEKISETLQNFLLEVSSGKAYIYRNGTKKSITLYKSESIDYKQMDVEIFTSVNKAWQIFIKEKDKSSGTEKDRLKLESAINKQKNKLQTSLSQLQEAGKIEERKKEADLKGNLILANKHKIPRASKTVDLVNIFNEKNEIISIKLNPNKTSVENAQYYFEKYKDIAEKKNVISLKKAGVLRELEELDLLLDKLKNGSAKDIQKVKEQMIDMNLIQAENVKKQSQNNDSLKYAFKRLIFENKWDIYIGKNGENNDLLTFTFANKSDLWFHAQGVAGAHVVVKVLSKDSNIPQNVIEQAARIAAANSEAKHSATVPVIYTQIKYVSRIRKALPGTVKTKNEKVIFVKPLNLNV
ncbi:MAG: DUF814 domain-containing protein [Calditrichae bacterium]|nr:DUF814 domain-containing protein [Calditrichia bacterium]